MLILECPHCQSCFSAEKWNESPHRGENIPETIDESDEFDEWRVAYSGMFDCPECGQVALTEDMTPV